MACSRATPCSLRLLAFHAARRGLPDRQRELWRHGGGRQWPFGQHLTMNGLDEDMTLYSHSRLQAFEQCRLKYRFNYIDRIKREEESIEAFLGSRFHEAMEKLYAELAYRSAAPEDLRTFFNERWDRAFGEQVYIVKKDRAPEDYRAIGLKAIDDYWRRYHPFTAERTLGLERRLIVDLDGDGRHQAQCYIDRIARRPDGVLEIHDYKTSAYLPAQQKLDDDRQLGLYELAVRQAWPETKAVELVWHFVAFDEEMRSRRSPEALAALRERTVEQIDAIESCEEFPPTESPLCPYCSFQDICPLFAHLFRTQETAAIDAVDDGITLVDRFTALEARRREMKAQIVQIQLEEEELRQAAVAIAEREQITRIYGHDHKLTVRNDVAIHYPKHGEEGRAHFEIRMREAGLWDRVVDVNYMTLHGIAKRAGWVKALPETLAGCVGVEPVKRVTLSKRKDVDDDES